MVGAVAGVGGDLLGSEVVDSQGEGPDGDVIFWNCDLLNILA